MSKYIRTEDSIMKVDNYLEECEKWQAVKYLTTKEKFLQGTQQANTIEELCDEFVVFDEMNKCCMEIIGSYSSIKNNGWIDSGFEIYGAIWTDKGLIYVAKMNEKGELELI